MNVKNIEKFTIIIFSGNYDKIHYALCTASAALAINIPTTLFFTMNAIKALVTENSVLGWHQLSTDDGIIPKDRDSKLINSGLAGFEELLSACEELECRFMICEMGMKVLNISKQNLRKDINYREGGLVTILSEQSGSSSIIFI